MSAVVKFYENVEDQLLKFAVIIAKTDGKSVFAPDITEYHCEQIGRILGKIHAANITIDIMERQAAGKEYYQWKHLLEQVEEKIRSAMDFYRNIGLYNLTILCYHNSHWHGGQDIRQRCFCWIRLQVETPVTLSSFFYGN